jgi:hypothetical protein
VGSLVDQLADTLRRVSLEAIPASSLEGLAERLQTWFEVAPVEAPALVPPFALDIR